MRNNKAVAAVHAAICEDSLDECLAGGGRCVQAVEAVAPYMRSERELRFDDIPTEPDDGLLESALRKDSPK